MLHDFHKASKLLGIGQNKLFEKLRMAGVLSKTNLPKQSYINQGLFVVKNRTYIHPAVGTRHYPKTFVTEKGLDWIAEQLDLQNATPH